jgi:hypothetical protein
MRHVAGFSNSTKIRFIVNGFGMYGTVNDIFTKTATASHGAALRLAIQKLAYDRRHSSFQAKVVQWVSASRTKGTKCRLH